MKWKDEYRIERIYRLLKKEEIIWFKNTNTYSLSITYIREAYFTSIYSPYAGVHFRGKAGHGFITLTQCGNQIEVRIHHFSTVPPDSYYTIR